MSLKFLVFALALSCASAFFVKSQEKTKLQLMRSPSLKLGDQPWPFTICGQGKWTPTELTITNAPTSRLEFGFDIRGPATADVYFSRCDIELLYEGQTIASLSDGFYDSFTKGQTVSYARSLQTGSPLPPGNFGLRLNFYNSVALKEGCVSFVFKI